MTKTQLVLIARLLEQYADVRLNAGCNDLDEELFKGLTPRELVKFGDAFGVWEKCANPGGWEPRQVTEIQDFELIRFLAWESRMAAEEVGR